MEKKEYTIISGYKVYFPVGRTPFPAQVAVMSKVFSAAKSNQNALLESPTGTGKTLAFLSSTLAFLKANNNQDDQGNDESFASLLSPMATSVFIPASVPNIKAEKGEFSPRPSSDANEGSKLSKRAPKVTVYYCTRTHSQLQQIVDELRRCHPSYADDPKMCLMGSRQHYCINGQARAEAEQPALHGTLDEICRLKVEKFQCPVARDRDKFDLVASRLTNELKVWDIEDAVTLGREMKTCPYHSVKNVHAKAEYIMAPYNYVIDANIRHSSKVALANSIIVFDEAHNIEDVGREAGSIDIYPTHLTQVLIELKRLSAKDAIFKTYCDGLHELTANLLHFINDMMINIFQNNNADNTHTTGFGSSASKKKTTFTGSTTATEDIKENVWEGGEWLDIFHNRYNLNENILAMYREYFDFLVELQENMDEDQQAGVAGVDDSQQERYLKLSASTLSFLRRYLNVLDYMLQRTRAHADDYFAVIKREEESSHSSSFRGSSNSHQKAQKWSSSSSTNTELALAADLPRVTFHLWCMSAAVVFHEIFEQAKSVILTSGTLSPLDSFEGEFGRKFPVRLEANHVIDLSRQLCVGMISTFYERSFDSRYINQQTDGYQDTIGEALFLLAKQTPGGTLMFLPSYSLLNRMKQRWTQRKLIERIEIDLGAKVFFEPKDGNEMKIMLEDYYSELDALNTKAVLIAVCRGKVSEGINFSDHYARTVVIVGIPYPSLSDLQVNLKKQYQDRKFIRDKVSIDGNTWYRQQAFRAINQAIGRCIRHKDDFGTIVLLDPRFALDKVINHLSRWLRSEVKEYARLEDFVLPMRDFFRGHDSYQAVDRLNQQRSENVASKKKRARTKANYNNGNNRRQQNQQAGEGGSTTAASISSKRVTSLQYEDTKEAEMVVDNHPSKAAVAASMVDGISQVKQQTQGTGQPKVTLTQVFRRITNEQQMQTLAAAASNYLEGNMSPLDYKSDGDDDATSHTAAFRDVDMMLEESAEKSAMNKAEGEDDVAMDISYAAEDNDDEMVVDMYAVDGDDSNEARQPPQLHPLQPENSVKFFYEAEMQQLIRSWTFLQQPDDITSDRDEDEDRDGLLWKLPIGLPVLSRWLDWSELLGGSNSGVSGDVRICRLAPNDPNFMQLANTNNAMLQVNEEWCGTDQLVYRLYFTPVHIQRVAEAAATSTSSALQTWRFSQNGPTQSEQRSMLLAAQVLASSLDKDEMRGMVFGHPMLFKYAVKIQQST